MHGVEFAWRTHAAQEQWVARVDTKATVVFALEGVVVPAVLTTLSSTSLSGSITGWRLPLAWLGSSLSAVAVVAAFLVIFPQLDRRKIARERHFIYFGHLHQWDPSVLAEKISTLTDEEQIHQLATQLTRLGKANWHKYILLRLAVLAALLGTFLLVVSFAWPR